MQDGKAVLPLGTLTVEETKAPNGYLLDGAYMQAGDKSEQIKGLYVTQITEDGDLAVLSGSNQFSVSYLNAWHQREPHSRKSVRLSLCRSAFSLPLQILTHLLSDKTDIYTKQIGRAHV